MQMPSARLITPALKFRATFGITEIYPVNLEYRSINQPYLKNKSLDEYQFQQQA
jgi:hypothetical protein